MPSTPETIILLRAVSLFAETPDEVLAEIAPLLQQLSFAPGESILHKGDPGDAMFLVVTGRVHAHDGERTLNTLGPAEVFGEMALLDGAPRAASITADEPTEVLRLGQAEFYALAASRLEVLRGVIRMLNQHLRARMEDMQHDYAYIQQMARLTSAAAALEAGHYDPRSLDPVAERADALGQLARVFQRMASEVLARERRLRLEAIERDLQTARQIQASFLPESLPNLPGWEITTRFEPAREVSGDFYDVFRLPPTGRVAVVIADVVNKGVGAALFMALFRTVVRVFCQQGAVQAGASGDFGPHLRQAIELANDYIAETHGRTNMFATLFIAALDPASGQLVYVNGGHEPPLVYGPAGLKTQLMPTGAIVGAIAGLPFNVNTAQLEPGDVLLGLTDGITDARGPSGEAFTIERVYTLLEAPPPTAAAMLERVEAAVRAHVAGAEQFDDITLLAVKRESLMLD